MMGGDSVFLTGPPGAGKTFVLNQFVKRAVNTGKTVAVTASTGIAATQIGGTTLHSWSGLGVREALGPRDRAQLSGNARLVKRYNATDVLVIDEISMLHGHRLDMVNEVCKLLRKNLEPFGGLQVVLVGDLFQLPPVNRDSEMFDFVHLSASWAELNPKICYLSEQHRQQEDGLLDLLVAMRAGQLYTRHEKLLRQRLGARPDINKTVTKLYAHNIDIDTVNQLHLDAIDEKLHTFEMETKGSASKVEQLARSVLAPAVLELKKGAEVMFVANNPSGGFYNGTRGHVIGFDEGDPVVQLASNRRKVVVKPHSWKFEEDGRVRAEIVQLPLRLAWAITIHKSQGMSLDAAEIDLGKSFTPGMGYVALSRVRSLSGLYLMGINAMALRMHEQIYELDLLLQKESEALALSVAEAELEAVTAENNEVIVTDKALLKLLKNWRLARAKADGVPAYIVAHDSVLEALAAKPPETEQSLLGVKGFGPGKLTKYGPEIINIVSVHKKTNSKSA